MPNEQFWGKLWFGYNDVADRVPSVVLLFSKYESMCLACGKLFFYDEMVAHHSCNNNPVVWCSSSEDQIISRVSLWIKNPIVFANLCRAAIGNLEPLSLAWREQPLRADEPILENSREKYTKHLQDGISSFSERYEQLETKMKELQDKYDELGQKYADLLNNAVNTFLDKSE